MSSRKAKIYKIDNGTKTSNTVLTKFIVGLLVYSIVLFLSSKLFTNLYIENFWYAIIAALIISALDEYLKPFITFLTLPLTIMTIGIAYPIVNLIILNICDLLMGKSFEIYGLLSGFIISIFISGFKMLLDKYITEKVRS